jgi:hypothetical protein
MSVWLVGWRLLVGVAVILALTGTIANPVMKLFLVIVAATQL